MKHDPITPPPSSAEPNGPRWTPRKMADFLRELASTHSVQAAAKAVGMSRQSAYRLRARLKGLAFDSAWDEAFHHSYHNLAYLALERAMHGVEVPHFHKGELIHTSRRYDERLTAMLLKLFNSGDALIVGGLDPNPERTGQRLEGLLARIEADGELATDDLRPSPPAGFRPAFPLSDDELLAEFQRFRKKPGG
jgi:hypothetical protein